MGWKKKLKKAQNATTSTASKAGKSVENTASSGASAVEKGANQAGKAVENWATDEWQEAKTLGVKLGKTAVNISAQAEDLQRQGLKRLESFADGVADAIEDAVMRDILARLAKQIVKDNQGMIANALELCRGLEHVAEYGDEINALGEAVKNDSISDEAANAESNRLIRVTGIDQLNG